MNRDMETQDYILKQASESNVKFIRLWFTDITGGLKGFAINVEDLKDCMTNGVIFDGGAIEGLSREGENDTLAIPDLNTWQILPWRPNENAVARFICDLKSIDGSNLMVDSRQVLKNKLIEANKLGYKFYIGPEIEYYYLNSEKNISSGDDAGYFDQTSADSDGANLRRECVLILEQMGIPVRSSHHEVSPGQHEIDLRHTDALTMADSIMTTRLVVKETAHRLGGFATFMPRPFDKLNGSGLHLHLSLYKNEKNIFSVKNEKTISKTGESFMAGLIENAKEMTLITNQWANSYKRLLPNLEAPVAGYIDYQNIEDIVRVPPVFNNDDEKYRVEFRLPDAACNPYLAFATILNAGMLGIKNKYKITKKIKSNIPNSLNEAIKANENSNFLQESIGPEAYNSYIDNKKKEWMGYNSLISEDERNFYMKFL